MRAYLRVAILATMSLCVPEIAATTAQAKDKSVSSFSGKTSYYGKQFHGRRTASGERFDMHAMTAAHKTLPFGTKLKVTNKANGKSILVRVNDRGPHVRGRVLDLSRGAAEGIGMIKSGTASVVIDVMG